MSHATLLKVLAVVLFLVGLVLVLVNDPLEAKLAWGLLFGGLATAFVAGFAAGVLCGLAILLDEGTP